MGLLEKLLIGGGAALLASVFRDAQETKRRRCSPLRFDERLSQSDFTALATEMAHRTPRVIGADVAGMTVVLHIRSISGLSAWQAEVDFNDYGRLTGTYWINTDNADSQIPEHFADALSAQVVEPDRGVPTTAGRRGKGRVERPSSGSCISGSDAVGATWLVSNPRGSSVLEWCRLDL